MQIYMAILLATLGMLQFGYQIAVLNVPQTQIELFFKITFQKRNLGKLSDATATTLFSIATSLMLVGGILGALGTRWLGNTFGRKHGLVFIQLISLTSAALGVLCDVCKSFEMLFISRLLAGITSGLFTGLVPLYISEIAPVHLRGAAGTVSNLAVTAGLLSAMVLGLESILGSEKMWPYLLFVPAVPAIVQLLFLPLMPESPRFLLITKRNFVEGKNALVRLRGTLNVYEEVHEILQETRKDWGNRLYDSMKDSNNNIYEEDNLTVWQVVCSSKYRLSLFVCACVQLSQQLTGISALILYSTTFFQGAGIGCNMSNLASITIGVILLVMTLVSVVLMEKLGRRTLHVYVGMTGMLICSLILNFALVQEYANEKKNTTTIDCSLLNTPRHPKTNDVSIYGKLVVISTLAFVVHFGLGPSSVPWLISSEMFGQGPRAAAASFTIFCNWTSQLVVALVFPQCQYYLGRYSFLPFLVVLTMLWAILLFYLPETKNQSASQISLLFQLPNAWRKPIGFQSPKLLGAIRTIIR